MIRFNGQDTYVILRDEDECCLKTAAITPEWGTEQGSDAYSRDDCSQRRTTIMGHNSYLSPPHRTEKPLVGSHQSSVQNLGMAAKPNCVKRGNRCWNNNHPHHYITVPTHRASLRSLTLLWARSPKKKLKPQLKVYLPILSSIGFICMTKWCVKWELDADRPQQRPGKLKSFVCLRVFDWSSWFVPLFCYNEFTKRNIQEI